MMLTSSSSEPIQARPTQKTCECCRGEHFLNECSEFPNKSVEERYAFAKDAHLCFMCLKSNHVLKNCRSRRSCGLRGCSGRHHPLLHRSSPQVPTFGSSQTSASFGHISKPEQSSEVVSFAILPVRNRGPMEEEIVNAFLDNGSNTTLIDSALVTRLGLNGSSASLRVTTFNSTVEIPSSCVSFEVESLNRQEVIQVDKAWSVDNIPDLRPLKFSYSHLNSWKHLKGLLLPRMTDSRISLLIGANIPKAHWVLDQRRAGSNEPYAIKGPLGWVIIGPMSPTTKTTEESKVNCIYSNKEIRDSLEQMFNTRRAVGDW